MTITIKPSNVSKKGNLVVDNNDQSAIGCHQTVPKSVPSHVAQMLGRVSRLKLMK
jgi:hypothetical protein